MLRKLISKYGLATHLALLAAVPAALAQFLDARSIGVALLWLTFFAAIWLFAEPSIRPGEHLSLARARVFSSAVRDPAVWFFLVVALVAFLRWMNSGVDMVYNAEASSWSVSSAKVTFFPASSGDAGFLPFAVALSLPVLVCGVSHGLGYSGRVWFGFFASVVAAVGGLSAAVCVDCELPEFVKAATSGFADAPFSGSQFVPWLFCAIAAGVHAESLKWRGVHALSCLAVTGNAAALLMFSPPLMAVAGLVIAVFFAMFCLGWLGRGVSTGAAARSFVFIAFGSIVSVFVLVTFVPDAVRAAKVAALDPSVAFPESWMDTSAALSRIAKAMWLEDPWCGIGVGAFHLKAPFLVQSGEWAVLPPVPTHALNGFWMLLSERGVLGAAMVATGLLLLVVTYVRRFVSAWSAAKSEDGESFLLSCPPVVWAVVLAIAFAAAETAVSSLFSSSTVMMPFVALLSLAAAAFPRHREGH